MTSVFVFGAAMANYGVVDAPLAGKIAPVRVLLGRWCKGVLLSQGTRLSRSVQSVVSSLREGFITSFRKRVVASLGDGILWGLVGSAVIRLGKSDTWILVSMATGSFPIVLCPAAGIVSLVKLIVFVSFGPAWLSFAGFHIFGGERTWGMRGRIVGAVLVENVFDLCAEATHCECC
jgi:hypothetical protein